MFLILYLILFLFLFWSRHFILLMCLRYLLYLPSLFFSKQFWFLLPSYIFIDFSVPLFINFFSVYGWFFVHMTLVYKIKKMRGDNRAFQWSSHLSLFAICTNRSLATYWLKCLSFRSFILHCWHQWKFATDTVDGEWVCISTVLYQSKPGFNCFSISYSHNLLDCFSVMISIYSLHLHTRIKDFVQYFFKGRQELSSQ